MEGSIPTTSDPVLTSYREAAALVAIVGFFDGSRRHHRHGVRRSA
jgi:hypothetical protein